MRERGAVVGVEGGCGGELRRGTDERKGVNEQK